MHVVKLCLIFVMAISLSACTFHVTEQNFIRPQPDAVAHIAPLQINGINGLVETRQSVAAADGAKLNLVYLTQANAKLTVLYFGPNMFKLSRDGAQTAQRLMPLGVNLVLVDHRGSGGSSGTPSLALLEADALLIYDYVRDTLAVPPAQIVVHGLSLGSFMAAQVALQRPVAALVLEGSGTTVREWAQTGVPWYAKPIVRLDIDPAIASKGTLAAVVHSQAPLLILAGKQDKQAPWKMSQKLFDAASSTAKELQVVPEAGHMNILDWSAATDAYRRLLARVGA